MKSTCCVCGVEVSFEKAIKSEIDRRQMEIKMGEPAPIVGIVCELCEFII